MGWNNDIVIERVLKGYRMSPPADCPNSLYDVMFECWNEEAEKRPNFAELSAKISAVVINPNAPKKEVPKYQDVFTVAMKNNTSIYNQ